MDWLTTGITLLVLSSLLLKPERQSEEQSGKQKSLSSKKRIGIVAVFCGLLLTFLGIIRVSYNLNQNSNSLQQIVMEANQKLPSQVAPNLTMKSVSLGDGGINYFYVLHGLELSPEELQALADEIRDNGIQQMELNPQETEAMKLSEIRFNIWDEYSKKRVQSIRSPH